MAPIAVLTVVEENVTVDKFDKYNEAQKMCKNTWATIDNSRGKLTDTEYRCSRHGSRENHTGEKVRQYLATLSPKIFGACRNVSYR